MRVLRGKKRVKSRKRQIAERHYGSSAGAAVDREQERTKTTGDIESFRSETSTYAISGSL